MPIHEYKCSGCEEVFERLFRKRSSVRETVKCPLCGSTAEKMVSAANFSFGTPTMTRDGNSGVYAVDSSVDQVVGRDAERKKRDMEKREKKKRDLRSSSGSPFLTRLGTDRYRTMPSSAVEGRNELARFTNQAFRDARQGRNGWVEE